MFEIRETAVTGSTNDDAAALLGDPAHAGVAIVADFQSDGHGRRARAWVAPPGSSLLCTAILPEPVATEALWAVPFWTALCAAEAIEAATGIRVALQWPNDLLVDGRKAGGILCVSRVAGDGSWIGCGTGFNLRRPAGDAQLEAIEPPPAFLSDVAPGVERRAVLDALLAAYARRLVELGDPAGVARGWEERAGLAGTRYRLLVDGDPRPLVATALRVAAGGALVVADGDAERAISLADARVLRT